MTNFYPYQFEAPICHHDVGSDKYRYRVVYLPDALKTELPLGEYPRLRINGEVDELPFEAALTPVRGKWYILFSRASLSKIGKNVDDIVSVRFEIADQDAVTVPEALDNALQGDAHMQTLWDNLTAGKKRALAHRVASAKTAPTQAKRIREIYEIMLGKRDMRGNKVK